MKKVYGIVGIIALNLVAGQAFAFPIEAGDTITSHSSSYSNNGSTYLSSYPLNMEDEEGNIYKTFCLDKDAPLGEGSAYTVSAVTNSVVDQGDEISDFTKWIYAAYMENELPPVKNGSIYDMTYVRPVFYGQGTGYLAQEMVWWEEGESVYNLGVSTAYSALYSYYQETGGWANYSDKWDVQVLNFENSDGQVIQSQLVGVEKDPNTSPSEVPEPATMALLGLGLLGFAGISKKRNKK